MQYALAVVQFQTGKWQEYSLFSGSCGKLQYADLLFLMWATQLKPQVQLEASGEVPQGASTMRI